MFYNEFIKTVREIVTPLFPKEAIITLEKLPQNNGLYADALIIKLPGQNIAPTIYLSRFYDDYIQGRDIDSIADSIHDCYYALLPSSPPNLNDILDFEKAKNRIAFTLINYNSNIDWLRDLAHIRTLDLAMIFTVDVEIEGINGTFNLTTEHIRLWHKSPEELAEIATKNTPLLRPARLITGKEILALISKRMHIDSSYQPTDDSDIPFYVLTNNHQSKGAACMLYTDELKNFAKKLDDDIYIVPSSIHEVIILPAKVIPDTCELKRMIEIVNMSVLVASDILSNNLYYYSRANDEISIAI